MTDDTSTRALADARTTLRAGDVEVVVDAHDGARLRSLRIGEHEVLHTRPARVDGIVDPVSYGSFVMAPWAGRIRDARARFGARHLDVEPHEDGHGLHGLVLDRPWRTIGPGIHEITIAAAAGDEPGWFAPVTLRQTLELQPDGLQLRLVATAAAPTPVTLGWHPWFVRRLAGVEARVSLPPGARMLARDPVGIATTTRTAPPPQPWDDTFVELDGPVDVTWGDVLCLTIDHDGPATVVFTGRDHAVCVEPQSGPPDEVNGPEPRLVTPEQPLALTSTWRWS